MRTTKTEVVAVFERLRETVGVPAGGRFDSESRTMSAGWALDHNGAYGGWVVVGFDGKGTGESRPLGDYRMPAGQFVAAMHLAIRAVVASREVTS